MTVKSSKTRQPEPGPKGLRRSLHFVPGGNDRMFSKALELPADTLILDLEDAVAPAHKDRARQVVVEWLQGADFGGQECLVRINPQDSPWGRHDLEAVVAAAPDGLVLPKVATRANVDAIGQMVNSLEVQHDIPAGALSLVLIGSEVPDAVFNLPQLVRNSRVDAVAWGAEDLGVAIGAHRQRDDRGHYLEVFSHVRAICLLAAAAAEVQAVDAVYTDFRDLDGLKRECIYAADMGFTGKLTIHPDQIEVINTAFTPGAEAIAEAKALVAAFEAQDSEGAISFNGRMVDAPHLKQARALLALATRISGQTG